MASAVTRFFVLIDAFTDNDFNPPQFCSNARDFASEDNLRSYYLLVSATIFFAKWKAIHLQMQFLQVLVARETFKQFAMSTRWFFVIPSVLYSLTCQTWIQESQKEEERNFLFVLVIAKSPLCCANTMLDQETLRNPSASMLPAATLMCCSNFDSKKYFRKFQVLSAFRCC